MKRIALVVAVIAVCAAPLRAQTPIIITPDQYDPLKHVPPPPALNSAQTKAELAELKRAQSAAPAQKAAAAWDDVYEDPVIFKSVIGPGFDMAKLPATGKLMHLVIKNESATSGPVKRAFPRPRPWVLDPSIKTCTPHQQGTVNESYPSGHASVAYAMATVLVKLMPGKAQAILARANSYSENRIVCGYHYRSDIVAGKNYGILVGNLLLHTAAFKAPYDAAAAELRAAHLAP